MLGEKGRQSAGVPIRPSLAAGGANGGSLRASTHAEAEAAPTRRLAGATKWGRNRNAGCGGPEQAGGKEPKITHSNAAPRCSTTQGRDLAVTFRSEGHGDLCRNVGLGLCELEAGLLSPKTAGQVVPVALRLAPEHGGSELQLPAFGRRQHLCKLDCGHPARVQICSQGPPEDHSHPSPEEF